VQLLSFDSPPERAPLFAKDSKREIPLRPQGLDGNHYSQFFALNGVGFGDFPEPAPAFMVLLGQNMAFKGFLVLEFSVCDGPEPFLGCAPSFHFWHVSLLFSF
jgi:hypothetical protein